MKALGILTAYDREADDAKLLAEYLGNENMDENLRLSIIKYLRAGEYLMGLMEWWFDFEDYGLDYFERDGFKTNDENEGNEEARSIGAAGYLTDG